MTEGSERKLSDMVIRPKSEEMDAAEVRSTETMRRLEAAIDPVLEEIRGDVETMNIANRYRRDTKPSESPYADTRTRRVNPMYKDLNEAEFKRQQLLSNIDSLKQRLLTNVSELGSLVMEIEATKVDDVKKSTE